MLVIHCKGKSTQAVIDELKALPEQAVNLISWNGNEKEKLVSAHIREMCALHEEEYNSFKELARIHFLSGF